MKCQILFSRKKYKKLINLSSAELTQRVVKVQIKHNLNLKAPVTIAADDNLIFFIITIFQVK